MIRKNNSDELSPLEHANLLEGLAKLAKALAHQHKIDVVFAGATAYTKGRTIVCPALPPGASRKLVNALSGFIDQQVSALLKSDAQTAANKLRYRGLTKGQQYLADVIEHARVEHLMEQDFAGCGVNLHNLNNWKLEQLDEMGMWGDINPLHQLGELMRARSELTQTGDADTRSWLDKHEGAMTPVLDAVQGDIEQWIKLPSFDAAIDAAIDLSKKLGDMAEPPPQPQLQPPQQCDENQQQGGDEEGEQESQSGGKSEQEGQDGESESDGSDEQKENDDNQGESGQTQGQQDDSCAGKNQHKPDDAKGAGDGQSSEQQGDSSSGESKGEQQQAKENTQSSEGGEQDEQQEDSSQSKSGNGEAADQDQGERGEGASDEAEAQPEDEGDNGDADEGNDEAGDADSSKSDGATDKNGAAEDDGSGESDEAGDENDSESAADDSSQQGEDDSGDESDGDETGDDAESGSQPEYRPTKGDNTDSLDETARDALKEALSEGELSTSGGESNLAGKIIERMQHDLMGLPTFKVFTTELDVTVKPPTMKDYNDGDYAQLRDEVQPLVGAALPTLSRLLRAHTLAGKLPGRHSGRLNTTKVAQLKVGNVAIFDRLQEGIKHDTYVDLMVDCSGSMNGSKAKMAAMVAIMMAELLEQAKIKFGCWGYTDAPIFGGLRRYDQLLSDEQREKLRVLSADPQLENMMEDFSRVHAIVEYQFKGPEESLRRCKTSMAAMENPGFTYANADGDSLLRAAVRMARRPEKRKIMMVLSDGMPASGVGSNCLPGRSRDVHANRLKDVVKSIGMIPNTEIIGIGIMTDAVKQFYPKHFVVNNLPELPKLMVNQLGGFLRAGMASQRN